MSFGCNVIGLISSSGSKNIAATRRILRSVTSNFSAVRQMVSKSNIKSSAPVFQFNPKTLLLPY